MKEQDRCGALVREGGCEPHFSALQVVRPAVGARERPGRCPRGQQADLRRLLWLPSARRDEHQALAQASAQLARVGLADRAALRAGELSYGDQRRLEIARALAAHPTLLILDEPAAGMNQVEAQGLPSSSARWQATASRSC
ncbi:MAG: ATP-binding cassette domain-containing protein [Haloechinothrix sp.]